MGKKSYFLLSLIIFAALLSGCATVPEVDRSVTTQRLESLPRPVGPRKVVTIYQFRSTVPEVSAEMATDQFATALIKSGQFAVAERQRLQEGVMQEKQLSAQGVTTGDVGQAKLVGAEYIFEGAVTETNPQASSSAAGTKISGVGVEVAGETAVLGLDVRIIDARTGLVLDAINVRKPIRARSGAVTGLESVLQKVTKRPLDIGETKVSAARKEGVDQALRECIEEALYQIVKRYGSQ